MPHCPVTVVDIGMGYAAFHLFFQSFEDLYLCGETKVRIDP